MFILYIMWNKKPSTLIQIHDILHSEDIHTFNLMDINNIEDLNDAAFLKVVVTRE
jgi:hypothetical protein